MPHFQPKRKTHIGTSTVGAITRAFLSKKRFPFILIAVLALASVVVWADRSIQTAVEKQLRGHLVTILEADVEALQIWTASQGIQARSVAENPQVERLAEELLNANTSSDSLVERFAEVIQEPMANLGYDEFLVVAAKGDALNVLAATQRVWLGHEIKTGYIAEVANDILAKGGHRVTRPVPSSVMRADATGKLRAGVPYMAVCTPLLSREGEVLGALLLGIRPDKDFTRILQLAQFGESGETYAFDSEGRLLSQSRFDENLRGIGLLVEDPGLTSILNVSVRDPGVDLTQGERSSQSRSQQPLTLSAKAALEGKTGANVKGYRDYRGVEVIGAWHWLDGMGIGITTEVDASEAYAPLVKLRLAFGALVALVALTGLGTLAFMLKAARSDVARSKAEQEVESMGKYTLDKKLGQGGMGTVYLGRHGLLRRQTAVKILDPSETGGADAIARFEREVQATSQLCNPHTIAIYDYGSTEDGKFFYAMEYLDGLCLGDLVEVVGGPLPVARATALALQICESLAEAHAQGMVHRDVKPDNVMVSARGGLFDFVKVLDFGLVKQLDGGGAESANLTNAGTIVGTPLYMAPEQITGEAITPSADVYAVGGLVYHLLTGSPPFMAKSVVSILTMHVNQAPESLSKRRGEDVPPALEELVLACLAKAPADRPKDAGELLRRLRETGLDSEWTQADAQDWWTSHADVVKSPPQDAAKDPTGLSWLREKPNDAADAPQSATATMDWPAPGEPPA